MLVKQLNRISGLIFLNLLLQNQVTAATFYPVHLHIGAHEKATTLRFINNGTQEEVWDVRVRKWLSRDLTGHEELVDTDDVISSRPVVTLKPQESMTIRLVAMHRSPEAEDAYRVIVRDITPLAAGSVGVRLTTVFPLFLVNDETARGRLTVVNGLVTNASQRHLRIDEYTDIKGKKIKPASLIYLLPGRTVSLPVKTAEDIVATDSVD